MTIQQMRHISNGHTFTVSDELGIITVPVDGATAVIAVTPRVAVAALVAVVQAGFAVKSEVCHD